MTSGLIMMGLGLTMIGVSALIGRLVKRREEREYQSLLDLGYPPWLARFRARGF